jgi:hypothetical protein
LAAASAPVLATLLVAAAVVDSIRTMIHSPALRGHNTLPT